MRVTKALLESKNACKAQVDLFVSIWPEGVTLTEAICTEYASKFDVGWMAKNLFTDRQWFEYDGLVIKTWVAHRRIGGAVEGEYRHIQGQAFFSIMDELENPKVEVK